MGRAPCCDKANVKKGPWSPEEDAKLKSYIEQEGTGGNWIALPQKIGLKRCGKSCRLRWLNYLRPNIRHGGFSEEEDHIICSLYIAIGSRWSIIAAQLPGRTDNDIKNYWNTRLKKKLLGSKQRKNNQHGRRSKQEAKRAMEGVGEASMGIQQTQWHEPMVPNSQIENNGVYSHAMIRKLLIKLGSEHSMIHQQALGHSVDPIAPSVHTNSFTQGFSAMSGQIGHAPNVVPDELSEVLYCNMTKLEGLDCLYGVGGMVHDSTATSASESLSWSEECALLMYPSVASTYQVMQKHSSDHEQMNLEAQ